jgi:lambda family phage portal protein
LRLLRNRSRQLVRDNDYAKNAVRIIKNNVVGKGISFQGQVMMRRGGRLDEKTNDTIEKAWKRWCRKGSCSTSGKLSFAQIQRMVMSSVPTDGEVLLRKVRQRFGNSRVPFALELIEADQLVDNWTGRTENGNEVRMGVEVDQWQRPVAYWLYPRHPGDFAFNNTPQANRYIRVPADEVIHLGIAERPGQTRYVPWFHSALLKLNHMRGYEEAEIVAARAAACYMGFIQSPEGPDLEGGAASDDGTQDGERVSDLQAGLIKELAPGETFQGFSPTRPNAAMEPFMRYMLRSVCAGIGGSYESVSRDYSQSNYSSSRLAKLDDRDNWDVLQDFVISDLCQPVFEAWLEMAVLAGEVPAPSYELDPEIYQDVRWMPRGWDWIDPLKEVMARKQSVRAGFETVADVVSAKGGDYEEVFKQRRREIDLAAEYDLVLETDPAQVTDKGEVQQLSPIAETDTGLDADGDPIDGGEAPQQDDAAPADGTDAKPGAKSARMRQRLRAQQESHLLRALEIDAQIDALETLP